MKCEICGLRSERKDGMKRYFMARFPLDELRCKEWVKIAGNEDLAYLPIQKLHQLKFVCGKHFINSDFKKKGTQLKKTAVPSIRLTSKPLTDSILAEFPYHLFKEQQASREGAGEELGTETKVTQPSFEDEKEVDNRSSTLPEALAGPGEELGTETEVTQPGFDDENEVDNSSSTLPEALAEEIVVPEPKKFSWQEPTEAVPVLTDDVETEVIVDSLSMYCDDGKHDSLLSEQLDEDHKGTAVSPAVDTAFRCNVCDAAIVGFRYTCVQCSDLDLCGACEADGAHHQHYVLRVPADRQASEVQLVLSTIRRHLMRKLDPITQHDQDQDDVISLKSEIKSEEDNCNDDNNNDNDDSDNKSPEDDVLMKLTSPEPAQNKSDEAASCVEIGDEAPAQECDTIEIYMTPADLMKVKDIGLPGVQILELNEASCVNLAPPQSPVGQALVLSAAAPADSRPRVRQEIVQPQIKKRRLSSDLNRDSIRVFSYNTHHVKPDCYVRLPRLPDAVMNLTEILSAQAQAPSGDLWDSRDEDNR
ncbi:uncharacterized protein LOC115449214 isoform X3 [Manduca sexta]|uniref:uncharacterized protein LOC115449214 isoform X3 n=1 Tax=Manduca sexta TaxID=7130 RepID=UPI00188E3C7C|nr:uncharacterized protein LOC115449214 isoform X3 [Manduca sexta]